MIRSKRSMLIIVLPLCAADCDDDLAEDTALIDVADLRIRDPLVVTDPGVSSSGRDFRLNRKPSPGSILHYSWSIRSQTTMR